MFYGKTIDDRGVYLGADGTRWLLYAVEHPTARSRARLSEYDSIDEAADAWGLTYDPRPEPEPEN